MNETFKLLLKNQPDYRHAADATPKQIQVVNILFGHYTTKRDLRLYLVSKIIGRTIYSTNELSMAEASTLLDMAYTNREIDEDFDQLIKQEIAHVGQK